MGWFNPPPCGDSYAGSRANPPLSGVCAICLVDDLHNNGPRIGEEQINTVAVRNRGLPALRVRHTILFYFFFLPLQYILVTLFINAIRDGSRSNHFSYRTIVECAISPRIEEAQKKLTRVIGNYRPRFSRGDSANHRENCSRLRISVLASIFNRG